MNILSLFSFACFISSIYLGIYMCFQDYKNILNQMFFVSCLSLSIWAFSYTFFYSAPNIETAWFWHKLSSIGWCSFVNIALHFFIILTGNKHILKKSYTYILLYLPPLVLILKCFFSSTTPIATDLISTKLGWAYINNVKSPWLWIYLVVIIIYFIYCMFIIYRWGEQTTITREKKQSKLFVILNSTFLVLALFFDAGLTLLKIPFPPIATIIINFWLLGIYYIIIKYKLMLLNNITASNLILKTIIEPVILVDFHGEIVSINRATTELLEYNKEYLIGLKLKDIFSNNKSYDHIFNSVLSNKSTKNQDIILQGKNNRIHTLCSCSLMEDYFRDFIGLVFIFHDISQRMIAEEKLKHLIYHDKLTNLYNRDYFEKKLIELNKKDNLPLSIIMTDINGLKLTNDVFGHYEGDKLIKCTANILTENCRESDIICRWGGDEFLIILPNTYDSETIKICNRISTACENTLINPIPVSVSIGWSIKTNPSQDINDIVIESENMMYQNKLMESKRYRNKIITSLIKSLTEKIINYDQHVTSLQKYCMKFANALNLSNGMQERLILLSNLHDLGHIVLPENILKKTGKLTEKEWQSVKSHSEVGYKITQSATELSCISEEILTHHEKYNGTGYPNRLMHEEIPLLSRIFSIVDAYVVMTEGTIYKKAICKEEAINELKNNAGTQFDPYLVDVFIKFIN
ncbi:MAG: diguanylate cyclase [Eubacteriaceae bacterium]